MIKKYKIFPALIGLLFIIAGCGGGGGSSAPVDAEITIQPASVEITDGMLWDVHPQEFLITVKTGGGGGEEAAAEGVTAGIPLEDVDLRISFVWAAPDGQFDTLIFDRYCDGSAITPLVQLNDGNTPVNSPMTVKTDEDGSYILKVSFLAGMAPDLFCDGSVVNTVLAYSGFIQVTSGSLFTSAEFEVKAPD